MQSPTPGRLGRRYAPLVALAAVQVLLVAVAPSGPPKSAASTNLAASADGAAASGTTYDASGNPVAADASGNPVASAGGTAGGPATTARAGGAGTPTGGVNTTLPGAKAGPADMSHCDATGHQIGPTYYMPLCKPVWHGGDNGGSTMPGVTGDKINFLVYQQQGDAQVNAILATQGLAASQADICSARDAFTKELNKRWEFYGRKLVPMDGPGDNKGSSSAGNDCGYPFFLGKCQLTPPDPPCARAEAEAIAAMHPAFVIGGSGNVFYNEMAKRGIMDIGGTEYPLSYYSDYAPFRWDVFMDGTRSAQMMVEYYCKKMVGKPVAFAGPDVMHPDGNPLSTPPKRKVAILYPETYGDPVSQLSANIFIQGVSGQKCGSSSDGVKGYPYESDINKAEEQSTSIVTSLQNDHVTTVVCFCDPIAPVFMTKTMAQQNYHPEELMIGTGLIDYDVLGRLYEPSVWKYAFGLSHLQNSPPFAQTDAVKAWQDVGNSGQPDATENLAWAYFSLAGTMMQNAGPRLTPQAVRDGMFAAPVRGGWAESKGNPAYPGIKFASPNDYTGIDDAREVYWCPTAPSVIDNKPGAYVAVDGGHRYGLGEWPGGDPKVFPNAAC